jgi:hypothetical protein
MPVLVGIFGTNVMNHPVHGELIIKPLREANRVLVGFGSPINSVCMANYQSRGDQGTKVAFRNKIG